MAFQDHFSRQARAYARFRPSYPAELFAYLAWDGATGIGRAREFRRIDFALSLLYSFSRFQTCAQPSEKSMPCS